MSGQIITSAAGHELPREIPPVARRLFPAVDRVEIIDKHTVRMINATPDVTLEGRLSVELETSTDRPRRKQIFARLLTIAEREDPAFTVLHQNATFTAKRKDIHWKAAPSFAMDFRAANWGA